MKDAIRVFSVLVVCSVMLLAPSVWAAGFTAYNDLCWTNGQTAQNITTYTRAQGGLLQDHATGSNTPVTVTINNGGSGPYTAQGVDAASGTDAHSVFAGKVDGAGLISYGATDLTLTFSGLNSDLPYELAAFGNRDNPTYGLVGQHRVTKYRISGADSFKNISSAGSGFSGVDDDSTIVTNGYNTDTGYIGRFGGINPGADGQFVLTVEDGGSFSMPTTKRFYVNAFMLKEVDVVTELPSKALRITEIMYNPGPDGAGDPYEFLEFQNIGDSTIVLTNVYATAGITYTFPASTVLTAGQYWVIAPVTNSFAVRYGFAPNGTYTGFLGNGGEELRFEEAAGGVTTTVVRVDYDDSSTRGWPKRPDRPEEGSYSIVLIDPERDDDHPGNWRSSVNTNGTPGAAPVDAGLPDVVINEVMALNVSTIAKDGTNWLDWIELYNRTAGSIDLSGWALTDGNDKWIVPSGVSIAGYSNMMIWCDADNPTTVYSPGDPIVAGFNLNQTGEAVFMYNASTTRVDAVWFGLQIADKSIGRVADGTTNWTLTAATPSAANSAETLGSILDLRINEWVSNPLEIGLEGYAWDWIELYNTQTGTPVSLENLWIATVDSADKMTYPLSYVAGGGFVQLKRNGNDEADSLEVGLPSAGGSIAIRDESGVWADVVTYDAMAENDSMGRLPDGSDNVITFSYSESQTTPGESNQTPGYEGPILNEIMAWNRFAVTNDTGQYQDWIELYNPTPSNQPLAGLSLSDDPNVPGKWPFPAGSSLAAKSWIRVWCDGSEPGSTNVSAHMNAGFGMRRDNDSIHLFKIFEQGQYQVDYVAFGFQVRDQSIGLNGSGEWELLATPTPGATNSGPAALGSPQNLRFNEWYVDDAADDWFELINLDAQPVKLDGLFLSDTNGVPAKHVIPSLCYVGATGIVLFAADNNLDAGRDHVAFGLKLYEELVLSDTATNRIHGVSASDLVHELQYGYAKGSFPDGATNNIFVFTDPWNPQNSTPSPGYGNYRLVPSVVINEVLTHSDPPYEDAIELYNTGSSNVNIGGWFLSDFRDVLQMYQIPAGTVITAGQYWVAYETNFYWLNPRVPFSLDSAKGDSVYLAQADPVTEELKGWMTWESFGAATNGVSIGRIPTSQGYDFVHLLGRTLGVDNPATPEEFRSGKGAANTGPRVGPIVINEIMYNPTGGVEYIELHNITGSSVPLYHPDHPANTWSLSDAGDTFFAFPAGWSIPGSGYLLVVDDADTNAFRAAHGVSNSVPILGPFVDGRNLANAGDTVALNMPDHPQQPWDPDPGYVPQVEVDCVEYDDAVPWPTWADGRGPALERKSASSFGNDPTNWVDYVVNGTPGQQSEAHSSVDLDGDGMSDVWERQQFGTIAVETISPTNDYDGDGLDNRTEFVLGTRPSNQWNTAEIDMSIEQNGGEISVKVETIAAAGTGYEDLDRLYTLEYCLDLIGSSNEWLEAPDFRGVIGNGQTRTGTAFGAHAFTFVGYDSIWKYDDSGADLGTGWRAAGYDDSGWSNGPGLLGVESAALPREIQTDLALGGGRITYYFRKDFNLVGDTNGVDLKLAHILDDGAIFYMNGSEVYRTNMPGGAVDYLTPATTPAVGNATSNNPPVSIPLTGLQKGANVLAVEVHQQSAGSSDVVFGMELAGEGLASGDAAYRCKIELDDKQ